MADPQGGAARASRAAPSAPGGVAPPLNLIQGPKAGASPRGRGEGRGPPPDPGETKAPLPDDLGGGQEEGQIGGFACIPGRLERYGKARSRALVILRHVES